MIGGMLKRVGVLHVIALLLALIWVQLGGITFMEQAFDDSVRFVKNIGKKEEVAAPAAPGQDGGGLLDSYYYGYEQPDPASAASSPR